MMITESFLISYLGLKEQEKIIERELALMRQVIIKTNGVETKNYVALIHSRSRTNLAPKEEFELLLGQNFMKINNLYRVIEYKEIEIAPRPSNKYTTV